MQVLDDQDGRSAVLQGRQRGFEQAVALTGAQELSDVRVEVRRDVHQRAERARGGERVAGTPKNPAALNCETRPFAHKGRLPDPRLTVHEDQPTRAAERLFAQLVQRPQDLSSLDERHTLRVRAAMSWRAKKLRDPRGFQGGVLGEHQPLDLLQLGPGVDSELVGQHGPGPLIGRQCVTSAPHAVLRAHQQRPEGLPHGVPVHQRLQLSHRWRDVGPPQVGGELALEGVQTQPAEPLGLGLERFAADELRVRRTAPQVQGAAKQ